MLSSRALAGWIVVEGRRTIGGARMPAESARWAQSLRRNWQPPRHRQGSVDGPIAQGVDGRFDGDDGFRLVEMADREPRGELVSNARAERGLVPGVPQSRALDFSVLGPVEENDARIGAVLVGENDSHRLQVVRDGGVDAARFDQIRAGNRPALFVRRRVARRQFMKGLASLFGTKAMPNGQEQANFGAGNGSKFHREGPAGRLNPCQRSNSRKEMPRK
jgi:hypothetical protein